MVFVYSVCGYFEVGGLDSRWIFSRGETQRAARTNFPSPPNDHCDSRACIVSLLYTLFLTFVQFPKLDILSIDFLVLFLKILRRILPIENILRHILCEFLSAFYRQHRAKFSYFSLFCWKNFGKRRWKPLWNHGNIFVA